MPKFDTVHVLFDKLTQAVASVLPREERVIQDSMTLCGLAPEPEYIAKKRAESIAYLRSFTPSKYVLDGAKIDRYKPTILGVRDVDQPQLTQGE